MRTRVHAVLEKHQAAVFPGVYDALSAKIAERAGFELAFISGYAVSATYIGEPDIGLLTQTEIVERARRICRGVEMPIIVDADTGYGNALNVARTVRELIDAGAAGCFLEDQQWPKRCGHMRGKKVVGRGEYLARIRAAVDARRDADFFIVARTDAIADGGLDEAVARAEAARAAGADATFIEAPRSPDELAAVGRRAPKPTVANMVEQGRTPLRSRDELAALGFQLILYPLTGLFAAARALETAYGRLLAEGDTAGYEDQLFAFERFNELLGAAEKHRRWPRATTATRRLNLAFSNDLRSPRPPASRPSARARPTRAPRAQRHSRHEPLRHVARANASQRGRRVPLGQGQLVPCLEVHPALGIGVEIPGKPQRRFGRNATPAPHNLVDSCWRYANGSGQRGRTQRRRIHEVVLQNFTWMDRLQSNHGPTPPQW